MVIYVAGNNKTYLGLHVKCQILRKFEFSRQILIRVPSIKFQGNSSSVSRADARGQRDRRA